MRRSASAAPMPDGKTCSRRSRHRSIRTCSAPRSITASRSKARSKTSTRTTRPSEGSSNCCGLKPDAEEDTLSRFDAMTGRYVYLTIDGLEYRVYFEESGEGIPLLLQHTAGADGRQWRHLLNDPQIARDYRMIAYDLPYHGKSLPPIEKEWWRDEYRLTKDFLMQVPLKLS